MRPQCTRSVTLRTLVDYDRGELTAPASRELEEHLFTCDGCASRLGELARVEAGVRALVAQGAVPVVLTEALAARLATDGVRVREFRIAPGQVTHCGAAADDDLLVVSLDADLAGVDRAHLTLADDAGVFSVRHDDVPLDPVRRSVRVAYPGVLIRTLPDLTIRLRLATERADGETGLTEYTLVHSEAGPPPIDA